MISAITPRQPRLTTAAGHSASTPFSNRRVVPSASTNKTALHSEAWLPSHARPVAGSMPLEPWLPVASVPATVNPGWLCTLARANGRSAADK